MKDVMGFYLCIVFFSVFVLFTGCDYNDRKQAEIQARERAAHNEEVARLRASMDQVFSERDKQLMSMLTQIEKSSGETQKDIDTFMAVSAAAMEEKDAKGSELPIENRLLLLMRDVKINALAKRYLKIDFSRAAAVFAEEVALAQTEERRYFEAMKKADVAYTQSLTETENWLSVTREQREKETGRLKSEIAALETRRTSVLKNYENLSKHKLLGSPRMERERVERLTVLHHEIKDLDWEIKRKRSQIDCLTSPNAHRQMDSHAEQEKQLVQQRANVARDRTLRDIDRTMKPKRMLVNVVSECNSKTVEALQKAMVAELSRQQKQISELKSKIARIEEGKLLIPVSNENELNRLRTLLSE